MKKQIQISLLLPLLFSIVFISNAQENGHDAIYLRIVKEYTLNADGSMDFHYIKKQKLLSYRSIHSLYGETFIVYDPSGQTLKINDCYTMMANGKKIQAPGNSFNEVLPSFAANAPAYNRLREMVVTHTGIERNCVINLDYTIHSEKGYFPELMGNEVLAEAEPVQVLMVKIKVPMTKKFIYRSFNFNIEPDYSTDGIYAVYTWMVKDVDEIVPEENQKGGNELYPRIIFSSSSDRNDLYSTFTSQEAFRYMLSDDMKKEVERILGECQERSDILLKLQDEVVNDIHLWPVPLRYTGYKCRTPEMTWQSNGGTLMEKAVLLTALLREGGISADPVLVIREPFFEEKMGTLADAEDIVVKAEFTLNDPVYLSLTSMNPQDLKYNLPGRVLADLNQRESFPWIKTDELHSKITLFAGFAISENEEITGDISLSLTKRCNPWLTLLKDKNRAKSIFSGGLSAPDLKEIKIDDLKEEEAFINYKIDKEKAFKKDSNYRFYQLPGLNAGTGTWGIRLLPQERLTALEIPYPVEESYELNYTMPYGMVLINPEEKTEIHNSAGDLVYQIRSEEGKIVIKKRLNLPDRIITVAEYPDFKALMDRWNSDRFNELILKKIK